MSNEEFICEEDVAKESEEEEHIDQPDSPSSPRGRKGAARKSSACVVRCHICPKYTCKSYDTYKRHLRLHLAEDLYKSAPALEVTMELGRSKAKEILQKMQSTQFNSELIKNSCDIAKKLCDGPEPESTGFIDFVNIELCNCFPPVSRIDPAALNSKYVQNVSHFLADRDKRQSLSESLCDSILPLGCVKSSEEVDWFVSDFVLKLSEAIEVFYLKSLNNPRETILMECCQNTVEDDETTSSTFMQTIHYIGGSVVKSCFRLALRFKGNMKWDKISACLRARFVCGELKNGVEEVIAKWTESRDRGGLTLVSEACWCFLMAVSGILMKLEKSDGSVPHEEVLSAVKEDDIVVFLWSDLVEDELSEEDDDTLLSNFCRFLVNAWGNGVALRRKNAIVGRSKDKVPLRSSLCPK